MELDNRTAPVFKMRYEDGPFGSKKMVITVRNGKEIGLDRIGGAWKLAGGGSAYDTYAVLLYMPKREWAIDSAKLIYEYARKNNAPSMLDDWRDIMRSAYALPRAMIVKEADEAAAGSRRKSGKRYIWAVADYGDIRMKGVLYGLGFRWNKTKHCMELFGTHDEVLNAEYIISCWNKPYKPVLFNYEDIYSCFRLYKKEQEESIRWLLGKWQSGMHGALDADDMGIGKTLTALAAGLTAINKGYASRIIVVANLSNVKPTWIQDGWERLLKTPGLSFAYTRDTLSKARYKDKDNINRDLRDASLVVTNYEHLTSDANLGMLLPYAENAVVVFDEATKCSHWETQNARAAFKLSMCSAFSIGLTGTPMSKNIKEAWSIFNLLDPGIYPFQEFADIHQREKKQRIWIAKYKKAKEITTFEYVNEDIFFSRVSPYFIRHEKEIAPEQSVKVESRYSPSADDCEVELQLAERIRRGIQDIYKKDIEQVFCSTEPGEDGRIRLQRWQISALGNIQSALDDPYILYETALYKKFDKDVRQIMKDGNLSRSDAVSQAFQLQSDPYDVSPKPLLRYEREQQATLGILESIDKEGIRDYIPAKTRMLVRLLGDEWKGSQTVVFTSFSRTAARLVDICRKLFPERYVGTIHGSMPQSARAKCAEDFEAAADGILVCTDAMAFGANLQFARSLVHYNIPWTSSIWKQRTDRIFRTGSIGRKDIVYLTLPHPIEDRKIEILDKNLETIKNSMGIELSAMPESKTISLVGGFIGSSLNYALAVDRSAHMEAYQRETDDILEKDEDCSENVLYGLSGMELI